MRAELRLFENIAANTPVESTLRISLRPAKDQPKKWRVHVFNKDYVLEESHFLHRRGRFGKVVWVLFGEVRNGSFHPLPPPTTAIEVGGAGWSPNTMEFATRKGKEYIERFEVKGFFDKYGSLIQVILLIGQFLLILYLFRQMAGYAEALKLLSEAMLRFSEQQLVAAGGGTVLTP